MKEGWEYKKLGEVCKTSSGGTPSKSHKEYYEGGSIPWLRSGEVAQGLIYDTELCITEIGLEKSSAKIFPIDTVVIAMYGATVGQVGILKCEMSTNQAVCGIFPNSKLYPLFLLYCLKSKKTLFLKEAVGGAQPNISQNLIKNTVIPIPPLAEQERIVAELDLLSSIIDKKKAQLKELDQLAQSIFYTMFGDPITNEKGWKVKKLGEVCLLKAGKAIRAAELKEKADNTFPCYGGNGIRGYINKVSHKNDLPIIGRQGALCGNVNYAKAPFYATEHAVVVTPLIEMNIKWFYNELKLLQLEQYAHGVAQPGIAVSDLSPISFPIPPLPLQQEFASKIEAIERQKSLIQQSIVETQTLFDSRMEHWFN